MESIKKNFVFNSISSLLSIIVPIITTPYITRVLGPKVLGEYSFDYTVATYFVTVALLGINNYGNRAIASIRDDKEELKKNFWSIYFMQLGIGLFVSIFYIVYAIYCGNLSCLVLVTYVFSATISINWFFYGMEQFKLIVPRNIIIKMLTTISIFIFVKSSMDMWKYALIVGVGSLISEAALWTYLFKFTKFYLPTVKEIIVHLKPNFILFIPVLAVSLYKLMDKVMLGILASKTEVGYYEATEKLIQIPNALVVSLGTVMLPRMSNLCAKNDEEAITKYIRKSMIVALLIATPMCWGIMSVAKELVPIFFGCKYEKCVLLIQFLLPSCIFVAIANVVRTQYLIPMCMDREYIISVWFGAVINLVLNFILIPRFMSVGATIGTLCAEICVCIYQLFITRHIIQIKKILDDIIVILACGLLMYICLYFSCYWPSNLYLALFCKVLFGGCFFVLSMLAFWFYKLHKR